MSIATVGQAAIILTVCGALMGMIAGLVGARVASEDHADMWLSRAERGLRVALGGAGVSSFVLVLALLAGDYSLQYVIDRTSNDLAPGLRFTAWWSGQEGSLLLWLLILLGYGTWMAAGMRRTQLTPHVRAGAVGVLSSAALFFAVLCAWVARPFKLAHILPVDGAGMSPALQNYWMAIHPPALYFGYVAVAVPFALVMGSACARDTNDVWVPLARRWMLVAWIGLSAGLILGARWAYEEIGWGGYWAWDPVENAALMPWLTATAFMHSIMVQQRRGMLRSWNAGLVSLTFCLSIFGTFITRSGVLSSVHSFVSSPVGWWFIGFLAVMIVVSVVMLASSDSLRSSGGVISSVASREAVFLFNGLILVAIALTVLWGVLYPLLSAAISGNRESLQAPWFNFFLAAFGLPLLVLMAIGNEIPWRGTTARMLLKRLQMPFIVGVLTGALSVVVGGASSPASTAGISFGAFVAVGVGADMVRTIRARRSSTGERWLAASGNVVRKQRRRIGGHIAHVGVGLLAIAISANAMGNSSVSRTIKQGETVRLAPWSLTYTKVSRVRSSSSMQVRATFNVSRNGTHVGSLSAGRNFYPASGEVSNEVGVHRDLVTAGDLFVTVDRLSERGDAAVKVIRNPMINLLWAAGLLAMTGGMIAAWPQRRRDRSSAGSDTDRRDAMPAPTSVRVPTATNG